MTCWLIAPPGTCRRVITLVAEDDSVAISPARSMDVGARDLTREDERLIAVAETDVLAREERRELLLQRRDPRFDDDVVLSTHAGTPQDQTDRPRRSTVDQYLAGLNDACISDVGVGDGKADDVKVGRKNHRPTGGDDQSLRDNLLLGQSPAPRVFLDT